MAGRENALLCDVSFDNNVAELTCERRGRPSLALVCAELASSANESSPKRTDSKRSDSNGG